jgi:essential nuclear protein 1
LEDEAEYEALSTEALELSAEDAAIMAKLEANSSAVVLNLSDLIKKKEVKLGNSLSSKASEIHPKVVEVYGKVGLVLSRYTSGKLPKAFKLIPNLNNWEEILLLTKPEEWTVQAMYQATRLFASNLNAKLAQNFYKYVLLERVRRDYRENKKLNHHLYMALKKCVYKPAAFFKGILLPLVEGGCTLKEAAIVGSVMVKTSIPALHSAAATLKLVSVPFSGAQALILKYMMDKRYAFPYKVIESLVHYFVSFTSKPERMPVLWLQSLLFFVQRYKADLSLEHIAGLNQVAKVHYHEDIFPEIDRELQWSLSNINSHNGTIDMQQ